MSKGEVVILDCWVSPFCMRAKVALGEKGVEYEHREEDLFGGKSDLLLKSNPIYKKVPVLLHKEKPVCESTIIVSYIDEAWPLPAFLPTCSYERAQARFWADFIDKKVFDAGNAIWRSKGEEQEAAKKDFIEILKTLESEALKEKDYFGGDKFGFVDIILIGLASWFNVYEKFGGFKLADHCPKLDAWKARCIQRETVSKVIPCPDKAYEFVVMFRKMQGIE